MMGGCGLDSPGLGQGPVVGSYKYDIENSGATKCWEYHTS
jgi:hypothetical protein